MLDSGARNTIEELKAKFFLEPAIGNNIYVEGTTDKALLEWFLKSIGLSSHNVLLISTVEIEKDEVLKIGLKDNNRNRIIVLTNLIEENIIGIIDSDFYFLENQSDFQKNKNLLLTDYANFEMYLFNEKVIEKILIGFPEKRIQDINVFFQNITNILKNIFLIRYAKEKIDNSLAHVCFLKNLNITKGKINFDREKYLVKYVKSNYGLVGKFNDFISQLNLKSDDRKMIHGHDFTKLLCHYLGITTGEKHAISLLYASLEISDLKEEQMFVNLLKILK